MTFEEPGRLSTASARAAPPAYGDEAGSAMALPIARLSESSRSDGSSGDHGVYASTTTTHTISTTTTFFRLPRRRRDRGSLFPLPVKIPPPDSSNRLFDKHRTSIGGSSLNSPAHTIQEANHSQNDSEGAENPSPLPSPSHSALTLASTNPTHPSPPIIRKQSTNSARSIRSSPSMKNPINRLGLRERSSTSVSHEDMPNRFQDGANLPESARTSTSTTRKSFGDLFHRARHHSDPLFPRANSPAGQAPGTPLSNGSKNNSINLNREPSISFPARLEDDTPAKYLERLQQAVHRGVVAIALSRSGDEFSHTALRKYMRTISYFGDPMDMAIRKLLMEVELPKETQQIDRVLQGFADRYYECNPGIYHSPGRRC